ncbi:hypothetical protein ACS0TY_008410 [Phlomoides rotata]
MVLGLDYFIMGPKPNGHMINETKTLISSVLNHALFSYSCLKNHRQILQTHQKSKRETLLESPCCSSLARYYVNNDYDDEKLKEDPPAKIQIDKVQRNILADKPRVTKFPINFHHEKNENAEAEEQPLEPVAEIDVEEDELPCNQSSVECS